MLFQGIRGRGYSSDTLGASRETTAATSASSPFWHEALVVELFTVVVAAGRHEVEDALTSRRLYSRLQVLPANFRWGIGVGCRRVGQTKYMRSSAKRSSAVL